jgi:hypothetical protein
MSIEIKFWIFAFSVATVYLVAVRLLIWPRLAASGKKLLAALTVAQAVTFVLNAYVWLGHPSFFWRWFLNIDKELSLGTLLNACQLMAVAFLAVWAALRMRSIAWWERLYWCALGALFLYLSADEYFEIHERALAASRYWFAGAGLIAAASSAALYWFSERGQKRVFALILVGLAVMGALGVGGEPFIWRYVCHGPFPGLGVICHLFQIFEEFGEVIGSMIVLLGLVTYLEENLAGGDWQRARRLALGWSGLWLAWMVAAVWPLPGIEARYLAEPVEVDYLDGRLSLIGYRVSDETLRPGDGFDLTLYWRANDYLPEDFALSAHVLTLLDNRTVTKEERTMMGRYPTRSWLPGVVVRKVIHFKLPEDLPTPASYALMVTPWNEVMEATISRSDLRQIGPDTVILDTVAVIGRGNPPPPSDPVDYRFADGFTLYGYELPESGEAGQPLELAFWWRTERAIGRDLTQFIHLVEQDGDAFFSFDQPPFGGAFPTYDWPGRMAVRDAVSLSLPPDLPPGTYQFYTGMYEWPSLERVGVESDGGPIPDKTIYLGEIVVRR